MWQKQEEQVDRRGILGGKFAIHVDLAVPISPGAPRRWTFLFFASLLHAAPDDLAGTLVGDAEHHLATALVGRFKYNTDVFDRDTIVRLCEQYRRTLESVVDDPGRRIADPPA